MNIFFFESLRKVLNDNALRVAVKVDSSKSKCMEHTFLWGSDFEKELSKKRYIKKENRVFPEKL